MALLNRCIFTPTNGGSGDFVVYQAVTGFLTPAGANAVNGSTYSYAAELRNQAGTIIDWEVGQGAWTAATSTLARTTVLFSSQANGKVNFGGVPRVMITVLSSDFPTPAGATGDLQYRTSSGTFGGDTATTDGAGNLKATTLNSLTVASPTSDTGNFSIAVGVNALLKQTASAQWFNTVVGSASLGSATALTTAATENTAIGWNALNALASGADNLAVGANAVSASVGDKNNSGVGVSALAAVNGGVNNTALGQSAGLSIQTGNANTFVGSGAGFFLAGSGNCNTMVGGFAGELLTGGSGNTILGAWFGPFSSISNCIIIAEGGDGVSTSATPQLDYNFTNTAFWTFASPPIMPTYTVVTLPVGVTGALAYVTDGDAGLAWGATAVNSGAGATKYLVWYNGAHWTVAGK